MLGRAAVTMWWDIAPEVKSEWEDWHSREHMPERLGIPGFLRGTRWIALSGDPSYFVLYEAARLTTVTAGPYVERLNNPTPWSQKMMPHHRNMVRSLCRVRASLGRGIAHAVATIRFSPSSRRGKTLLSKWLAAEVLPTLPERRGLTGAHLLESQPMPSTPQTAEQKIRGKDAQADWVLLICGYDADAVNAVVTNELNADAFAKHGALPARVEGLYRPAYSLTPKDLR
jgi:hypothetical protein